MELELHQLTLRYERLRKRHPRAERAPVGAEGVFRDGRFAARFCGGEE